MTVIIEYLTILNLTGALFGDQDTLAFTAIDRTVVNLRITLLFFPNTSIGIAENITTFHHPQGMHDEADTVRFAVMSTAFAEQRVGASLDHHPRMGVAKYITGFDQPSTSQDTKAGFHSYTILPCIWACCPYIPPYLGLNGVSLLKRPEV